MQIKVDKFGKNRVGMWVLCDIFGVDTPIIYHGLVNLDKEYDLKSGSTYAVKSCSIHHDKKGILRITLAL